jgi:hypothetical protein
MFASRRFSLRGLLSLMTGLAFVGFVANWLLSLDSNRPWNLVLFVLPWAIGSLAGIAATIRLQQSTLLGSIIGGVVAAILCPGSITIYLYLNSMNGINSLSSLWFQLAFAACGSGLLSAFVGIPREGICVSNKQRN